LKAYEGKDLRNVAIVGHGHSGKTMLVAALLYASGSTNKLTRPDEGNTLTDFDDEEINRKLSISTSVAFAEWNKTKINLLDTPGFNIFIQDARAALIAADSALVVVDGIAGVEVMTEKVVSFADEQELPRLFVINKLDRERSSFERALESIQGPFGRNAVPVQLPIGSEKNFTGIVDLIAMKAYQYTPGGDGKGKEVPIPSEMEEAARVAHEALVEMVAEGDDALLEEFFAEGTLPVEHITTGLQKAIRERRLSPVLCASAAQNIGTDQLLNFIAEYLPSPVERGTVTGVTLDGSEVKRNIADNAPLSLYAIKTLSDPFAGRLTFFKVMSGVLHNDEHAINARSGTDERMSHIGVPLGKQIKEVSQLHAGDIGAVPKLRDTLTGDTLCLKNSPIAYKNVVLPEPSIAYAIEARSRNDEDRMGNALHKILEEDINLRFFRDPQTKEFLIAGNGQQHIEIVVSRLKKRYGVEVAIRSPKVPYRETIRARCEVQGRHKKQTGGHGQFGDCWIRMEPLPRGEKFQFANEVFGGAIPKNFIPAIEKGIIETAEHGVLAGYPVVDFKVTVFDGSYHDVDSSEMAFKLAARKAFKAAMQHAKPSLLEPVMSVEIQAPVEFAGDLMGDLNGRRGRIAGMETKGALQIIRAQVPMAEMLDYQNDLISMTQGRASFTMEFDHYDYVPQPQAEKIIAAAKAARVGVDEEEE
jgi:elongation factor G